MSNDLAVDGAHVYAIPMTTGFGAAPSGKGCSEVGAQEGTGVPV